MNRKYIVIIFSAFLLLVALVGVNCTHPQEQVPQEQVPQEAIDLSENYFEVPASFDIEEDGTHVVSAVVTEDGVSRILSEEEYRMLINHEFQMDESVMDFLDSIK